MAEAAPSPPPRSRGRRIAMVALLLVLLALVALAGARSLRRVREYRRAETVCDAVERRDWAAALADPRPLGATVSQLREADCRCIALLVSRRGAKCEQLAERLLADPATGDWLPRPGVTSHLVTRRAQRGDIAGAAALARRLASAVPAPDAVGMAALLTAQAEGPREAIGAYGGTLAAFGDHPSVMSYRLTLGAAAINGNEWEAALAVLGQQPPQDPEQRDGWYRFRLSALAMNGQMRDLKNLALRWSKEPGRSVSALAFYAALLSATQQRYDPDGASTVALLTEAVRRADEIHSDDVLAPTYQRYIGSMALLGNQEEALRVYDLAVARFPDFPLDRDDLTRMMDERRIGGVSGAASRVELAVDRPEPGMTLLVSPDAGEPRDAAWQALALPPAGRVAVDRGADTWPLRWVLRDAQGRTRGSGAVWPAMGSVARAQASVRPPAPPSSPPQPLRQRPPAGEPRLVVVVLDCGDWRFVQHGRARGELPTFDALLAGARTAVLDSWPPLTASAMKSIVKPGLTGVAGVLGLVHHLGSELQGLAFVTSNPAAPIAAILPQGNDLFLALGAGDLRAANLLHSYGGMQLGRNGETRGPQGAAGMLELGGARRLRPDELALAGVDAKESYFPVIAGDFDDVRRVVVEHPDVGLVLLRVAALDLITHGSFPETAKAGQDDGRGVLFGAYRYIDRRLGELYRAMDGNDVLLVMSDHGAKTALEHHRHTLFLAAGGGVEPGRIPGNPDLRGVPRMLAEFFAVPTDWPDSGLRLPRRPPASP